MRARYRMLCTAAAASVVVLGPVALCASSPAAATPRAAPSASSAAAPGTSASPATPATVDWSPANIPEPAGAFSGVLLGSACATATDCDAVGWGSTTGSPIGTLIENWNGTAWSPVASPDPDAPGDTFPQLNAVSCPTTTSCNAVGTDLTTSNDSNTVVESYDGTSWSVIPSPDVSGATNNTLSGVTCRSANSCVAVGNSVTTSPSVQSLIEQWNGTTWSIDPSPNVSGALQTTLTSVACPSADVCVAVGYSLSDSGDAPLVEQWNGTTWSIASPAIPPGSADNELTGVACPAKGTCVAVGRTYATNSSPAAALAEQWNGTTWSVEATPNPSGVLGDFLVSVSCSTATVCQAAGEAYLDDEGDSQTLVERLAGGSWTLEVSPNAPGTTTSLLSGVACPVGSSACVAVGQSYVPDEDSLLALSLEAKTWDLTPVDGTTTPARSSLQSVGCSTTICVAVGNTFPVNSFDRNGLIEQWDGTDWSLGVSAEPTGAVVTDLNGAACPTTTACLAVGDVGIGTAGQDGQVQAFAESWDGSAWSPLTPLDPSGATYVSLTSVSCTGATDCTAVGYGETSPGGTPTAFAEQWSAGTWTLQSVTPPAGATATTLAGVSCPAARSCTAVGSDVDASGVTQTLVEQWDGTAWSVSSSPDVAGSTADDLLGVSCTHATDCTAVGYSEAADGDESTLAEQLTAGSWAVQTTPDVAGAFYTVLSGVSCPQTSRCVASGYSVGDSGDTTLVEQWNGSAWSVANSATIAGDYASGLNGIACTPSDVCSAAGAGPDGFGQDDALIEQN
ncbi:MAG: hypothetical protein ACLPVF_00440 [Acidimicrobiales bacterium]